MLVHVVWKSMYLGKWQQTYSLWFQELYLAFNDIVDVSPLSMLDNLRVLDLEGLVMYKMFDFKPGLILQN